MTKKGHYINEAESEQIFRGLILRLGELLKTEDDQENAEIVLHLLSRLIEARATGEALSC